jgi:hypothetical protein
LTRRQLPTVNALPTAVVASASVEVDGFDTNRKYGLIIPAVVESVWKVKRCSEATVPATGATSVEIEMLVTFRPVV